MGWGEQILHCPGALGSLKLHPWGLSVRLHLPLQTRSCSLHIPFLVAVQQLQSAGSALPKEFLNVSIGIYSDCFYWWVIRVIKSALFNLISCILQRIWGAGSGAALPCTAPERDSLGLY